LKVPENEHLLHADTAEQLRKIASSLEAKGVRVKTVVVHGDAASEIVLVQPTRR
jgi:predicted transcriptional regulator